MATERKKPRKGMAELSTSAAPRDMASCTGVTIRAKSTVFQIACHEEAFGLERLLRLCQDLAPHLHAMNVGRVIARPFTGVPGDFKRTANRHDYAMDPPAPTLLDWVQGAGRATHAIGKIGDIFSMKGVGKLWKGKSDLDLFDHLDRLLGDAADGSLTFANFVEFDSLYGHPRDVAGYARGKLQRKRLDLICANQVGVAGTGFESDDNALLVIDADDERALGPAPKRALAGQLLDLIAERLA